MSEHDILYDIGVAVRFLADINGSEWIKGNDAGAVDMRQRAVAAHAAARRPLDCRVGRQTVKLNRVRRNALRKHNLRNDSMGRYRT